VDAFRFGVLAAVIVVAIATVMLVPPVVEGRMALQVVISFPLLAALYVVSRSMRLLLVWVAAGLASTALSVAYVLWHDDILLVLDLGTRVVFFAFLAVWIAREVLRQAHVSMDTILGGICVYLLLGLLFAFVAILVAVSVPGAYATAGGPVPVSPAGRHSLESLPTLLYFSFSALTTMGFGDITPVAQSARLAAMAEGMIGQLFPAIFIARLVGLHVAQRHAPRGEG
jgi:hypothetical protein